MKKAHRRDDAAHRHSRPGSLDPGLDLAASARQIPLPKTVLDARISLRKFLLAPGMNALLEEEDGTSPRAARRSRKKWGDYGQSRPTRSVPVESLPRGPWPKGQAFSARTR